jgi:hypothetical protein
MTRFDRFWFRPESTAPLALLRISVGLIVVAWAAAYSFDVSSFLTAGGVLPRHPPTGWRWGALAWTTSDAAASVAVAAVGVAGACLAVGYRTRVAAVVAWAGLIAITRRNPLVTNAGDALLRNLVLFLALAPAGAALSLDRWRADRARFWQSPARAPWALRLVQIQVSMVYLFSLWGKLRGVSWRTGLAVGEALRVGDLVRLPLPDAITGNRSLVALLTYGTLVVEAALAVLVWHRRLRPFVLAAGLALHLFIEATLTVGFFSAVMIASYLAFLPPETADRLVERLRGRLARATRLALG